MKTIVVPFMLASMLPIVVGAADPTAENRNITIIQGQSSADGTSQLSERLLEECIAALPDANALEPVVTSQSLFLKEINGDPAKNEFVKTYSASLDISYMIRQKVLVVVTTNSVQGQEPVMKVMDKSLQQIKHFDSNSPDGDLYAGRSHREYYFSTPEGARKDVLTRASAWIRQQAAIVCPR